MPVSEVLSFVYLALKQRSTDQQWDLVASGQPWRDRQGQKEVIAAVNAMGEAGRVRRKPWEVVDAETGVTIIGLELKIHGIEWLEKRPNEKSFLERNGVTPEQAIQKHDEWQVQLFKRFGRDSKGKLLERIKPEEISTPSSVVGGRGLFKGRS